MVKPLPDSKYGHLQCPADPVLSAVPGLPSGQPLPGPGLGDFQIQLLAALTAQTKAMVALTAKLDHLIDAMCESDGMDSDEVPRVYMDGSPVR